MNTKKYVITGGPGMGKTTIIEILAARGYRIVPEAARMIIDEGKLKGSDDLPWKNLAAFQKKVSERQIELENGLLGDSGEVFFDRGIVDGYGYCVSGNVAPLEIISENARNRYDKIFLLEPLSVYKKDDARFEERELGLKIHNLIAEAYLKFGYKLIKVPALSPEERADFIISHTKQI